MLKNRTLSIFAAVAMLGLAACGADEPEAEANLEEGMVTDTLIEQDTAMVPVVAPVPTADTAMVVTEADTAIDVDRDTVQVP